MSKGFWAGALGGAVAAAMLGLGVYAGRVALPEPEVVEAPAAPTLDKAAVEAILRDYLVANPEILTDMQTALEARREAEQVAAARAAIAQDGDAIFKDSVDAVLGNPNGDVTVVEFFDYNCGYCKHALADMQAMIAADPNLRFVLKEFPILGAESQKAAVVASAFKMLHPDKYAEFHARLLGLPGHNGEEQAIKTALDLGADEAALREKMKDPAIASAFNSAYELGNRLNISGTPSYVVGDEVVFGALGRDVLTQKVANVRQCAKATC